MKETKELRWKRLYFKQKYLNLVYDYTYDTGGTNTTDKYLQIWNILKDITIDNSYCVMTFYKEKQIIKLFNKLKKCIPEIKNLAIN